MQNTSGIAADKSYTALRVARRNITTLGLSDKIKTKRINFFHRRNFNKPFDIIVSNPPYIAHNDIRVNNGATHDPDMALYASDNGLAAYKAIAKNAKEWITDNGKLYLEIGIDQGTDIKIIFMQNGWNLIKNAYDLSGIERVLVFQKAPL